MRTDPDRASESPAEPPKKAYHPPELIVYGGLGELAQTGTAMGSKLDLSKLFFKTK